MPQSDVCAPLDRQRLGEMVAKLPGLARAFGWEYPTGAADYLGTDYDDQHDPELQFLRDVLVVCAISGSESRQEAWARLDARIEAEGTLDEIATAMI